MGEYKVPHFDAKGESNKVFTEIGVPTTFLCTSFHWDNLIHFGMGPKKDSDGKLAFTIPMDDKRLPGIVAEDIGKCAYGVFKKGSEYIGESVGIAGEHLTGKEMAGDLGNMFQFKRDFEETFCGSRSIENSRRLNHSLQTFETWLTQHKSRIPIE